MKLGTFVKWSYVSIKNKSTKICWIIFRDTVIQSLKSEKTQKSGLVPMSRQEKLENLFMVFPARLGILRKAFRSYFLIKRSRNENFRHFLVNFLKPVTMEMMIVIKILTLV